MYVHVTSVRCKLGVHLLRVTPKKSARFLPCSHEGPPHLGVVFDDDTQATEMVKRVQGLGGAQRLLYGVPGTCTNDVCIHWATRNVADELAEYGPEGCGHRTLKYARKQPE